VSPDVPPGYRHNRPPTPHLSERLPHGWSDLATDDCFLTRRDDPPAGIEDGVPTHEGIGNQFFHPALQPLQGRAPQERLPIVGPGMRQARQGDDVLFNPRKAGDLLHLGPLPVEPELECRHLGVEDSHQLLRHPIPDGPLDRPLSPPPHGTYDQPNQERDEPGTYA